MADTELRKLEKTIVVEPDNPDTKEELIAQKLRTGQVIEDTIYLIELKPNIYIQSAVWDDDTIIRFNESEKDDISFSSRWDELVSAKKDLEQILSWPKAKKYKKTIRIVEFNAIHIRTKTFSENDLEEAVIQSEIKKLEKKLQSIKTFKVKK